VHDEWRGRRDGSLAGELAAQMRAAEKSAGVGGARLELLVEAGASSVRVGGSSDADVAAHVSALRDWRSRHRGAARNVALVDTTLISTVHALTVADEPQKLLNAATLLDLAAFARAVVLYDRILVLPGARSAAAELNTALGEPVITPLEFSLEVDQRRGVLAGVGAVLGNLFVSALTELSSVRAAGRGQAFKGDLDAIAQGWSVLLGTRVSPQSVLDCYEEMYWDSDGSGLASRLVGLEGFDAGGHNPTFDRMARYPALARTLWGPDACTKLVSECNHRSYFNLRLAYALEVPYVGGVTRTPFRARLYHNARFAHQALLLHREIDRVAAHRVYEAPKGANLSLPTYAALAVREASDPRDVLAQIARLRRRGAALRRAREDYERALRGEDAATAKRLLAAVNAEAKQQGRDLVAPMAQACAAALAVAAAPTTALTLSLVGVLTALGTLPGNRRDAILRRLLRPAEWFLTSTSDTARNIATSQGDVRRVWQLDEEQTDWITRRLSALAALPPA